MRIPRLSQVIAPLLLVAVAGSPAAAAGGTLVGDFPSSDRPAIAIHGGATYIAAAGAGAEPGIHLLVKVGGTWTDTPVTTQRDRQPTMAIRDDGAIYLAFSRRTTGCASLPCTLGIYVSTNASGTWVTSLVHAGEKDVHPSIGLDDGGRPWIHFRAHDAIREAHRTAGAWSSVAIAGVGCCPADPLSGPDLFVHEGARFDAFRDEHGGGRIRMTTTAGSSTLEVSVTNDDDAYDPDIEVDVDDHVRIAYRRTGDGLWLARGDMATPFASELVTSQGVGAPAIAELPGGKSLVVAASESGIIYQTDTTGPWTGGGLTDTGGDAWPAVATTATGAARVPFLHPGSTEGLNVWLVQRSTW